MSLKRAARIERSPGASRQLPVVRECSRTIGGAVPAEKLGPVPRPALLHTAEVGEGDPRPEITAPEIAREHRAGRDVHFGGYIWSGPAPRDTEHPFQIRRHRQAPRSLRIIRQRETRDLDRIVGRHELQQLEQHTVRVALESRVPVTVSHDVFAGLLADRKGRGRPQLVRLFIPYVEHVAWRIAHRVVRPVGEQVLLTVHRPGAARAGLGDEATEVSVGDHVDPWRRRPVSRAKDGHVLAAILVEAAEAVEEFELRSRRRSRRSNHTRCRTCNPDRTRRCDRLAPGNRGELLGNRSTPAREADAGDTLQDIALHRSQLIGGESKGLPLPLRCFGTQGWFGGADQFPHQRL